MIERKTHTINAEGKAVGRLATEIALILRGKNKPEYVPNEDLGDVVRVSNIDKLKYTGKKLEQKEYYRYSGYPGGLKTTKIKELVDNNPGEILRRAVRKMLPETRLRKGMMKRLIIN